MLDLINILNQFLAAVNTLERGNCRGLIYVKLYAPRYPTTGFVIDVLFSVQKQKALVINKLINVLGYCEC